MASPLLVMASGAGCRIAVLVDHHDLAPLDVVRTVTLLQLLLHLPCGVPHFQQLQSQGAESWIAVRLHHEATDVRPHEGAFGADGNWSGCDRDAELAGLLAASKYGQRHAGDSCGCVWGERR